MTTYEEIKQARIDALRNRAERLEAKAETLGQEAMQLSRAVPFGQPILVGHHSEGKHRKLVKTMSNKMSKSVELSKAAEEAERRALAAENNKAINSKDSEAIAKLKAKIESEEQAREYYKKANAIYKKARKNLSIDQLTVDTFIQLGATEDEASNMLLVLNNTIKYYDYSYAEKQTRLYTYQSSYSSKEIKRCKDRIAKLESIDRALVTRENIESEAGKLVYNTELRGLELHFPGKPSEEVRTIIKQAGWKWSGRQKLWYAKATQVAEKAAKQVLLDK